MTAKPILRTMAAISALPLLMSTTVTSAMKMGDKADYDEVYVESKELPLHMQWVYRKMSQDSISFGDPVHEDMSSASSQLSQSTDFRGRCSSTPEQRRDFVRPPEKAVVSAMMCCSKSASSWWCDRLGSDRYKSYADKAPLITGTRWNDDPCHMTRRGRSRVAWAAWMLDSNFMANNNVNYASHYHEKQFLHAMTPSGRSDRSIYFETAGATQQKIEAWSEFAFLTANGTISPSTSMADVPSRLAAENRGVFRRSFGASKTLSVGFLFTGTVDPPELQVRQMAIGALLHTVQDSFSSSHVQREREPTLAGAPLVSNMGDVVRFLTYRAQDSAKHGKADRRPADLNEFAGKLQHPVTIGAELLACAAEGSTSSSWANARAVLAQTFKVQSPSVRATGGNYEASVPAHRAGHP